MSISLKVADDIGLWGQYHDRIILKSVIWLTVSIQVNNYWMSESIISELDYTSGLPQEVILILTQRKLQIHNLV